MTEEAVGISGLDGRALVDGVFAFIEMAAP